MKFYTHIGIQGNFVYLKGYDNGKAVAKKIGYKPFMFVPDPAGEYRTVMDNRPLAKLQFDSLQDGRNYYNYTTNNEARLERIQESSKLQNTYGRFPSPIDGVPQIHGMQNFAYLYLWENYKKIKYDPELIRVGYIDIETSTEGGYPDIDQADREITAITLRFRNQIVALGCGDYTPEQKNITYIRCKNEDQLLYKFVEAWEHLNLDVITGWNIDLFDIPYIINRITRQLGADIAKRLSPWGILEKKQVVIYNKEHTVYSPMGVSVLDYLQTYRKFGFSNQESYKLDNIAFVELGERKMDYAQYESLGRLHKENFQLYMTYNVKDVNLVYALDEKLKLLELIYAMSYDALVNFNDVFGTVRMWDVIIHNYLIEQHLVIPYNNTQGRIQAEMGGGTITGAYVKDPLVGLHKNVVSGDFDSLYPHLEMMYNISPDTLLGMLENPPSVDAILDGAFDSEAIEKMYDQNLNIAANGAVFTKNKQGFFPALMEKMYSDRVVYKKKMIAAKKRWEKTHSKEDEKTIAQLNNLQMAKKIELNSGYGALANVYFRFYDPRIAEAITISGQLSIRWVERHINKYLNNMCNTEGADYIIAVDTDSMYMTIDKLVPKDINKADQIEWMNEFWNKNIQVEIDKSVIELADYVHAYQQKMRMKREAIADKALWTAKKRYVLNMYDLEGVRFEKPKLKIMGSEAIRTSTPTSVRGKIKEMFALIMDTDEDTVQKAIEQFKKEFYTLPFEDIAFPRGCNGIAKWSDYNGTYKKSTPIHVKGAIMYNKLLRDRGLDKTISPVMEGEKIKFIYMKLPNPLHVAVVSVPGTLNRQLQLEQYIDFDTQFNKAFLEPMAGILAKIGWRVKKLNTLTTLFT